jgi:hypothetical protein
VLRYLEERLAKYRYAGIGEFHLYGEDADLPVPRRMVALARQHGLLLHAHSDVDAIERLFRQWPEARVLWAHSGFDRPEKVREVLRRHPRLWSDLAFRGDQANGSKVDPAWREAFNEFPDRFVIGTDTFTPERWHYIGSHADYSRGWLADLPGAARGEHRLAQCRDAAARVEGEGRLNDRSIDAAPARRRIVLAIAWPAGRRLRRRPAGRRAMRIEQGGVTLAFSPRPAPLAIGRHFSVDRRRLHGVRRATTRARRASMPRCRRTVTA